VLTIPVFANNNRLDRVVCGKNRNIGGGAKFGSKDRIHIRRRPELRDLASERDEVSNVYLTANCRRGAEDKETLGTTNVQSCISTDVETVGSLHDIPNTLSIVNDSEAT
jgi:hypothetical protein